MMLEDFKFSEKELSRLSEDKKTVLSKLNGHLLLRKNENGTVTGVIINHPDEVIDKIIKHHFGTEYILK